MKLIKVNCSDGDPQVGAIGNLSWAIANSIDSQLKTATPNPIAVQELVKKWKKDVSKLSPEQKTQAQHVINLVNKKLQKFNVVTGNKIK